MTRYVEWIEPYDSACKITCTVRITVEDAIKSQRASALLKGNTYKTDERALDDFIAVHWASIIERI